ncbi:unnamed protein product [Periconia digitata]|uniref:GP-PDE domain-containing protein n=1 Tax=Periconia digitata TaxID=1303443 RepID=A0A9W4UBM0_9PLEO|nr:unnamed protein product [Periconia digitata]
MPFTLEGVCAPFIPIINSSPRVQLLMVNKIVQIHDTVCRRKQLLPHRHLHPRRLIRRSRSLRARALAAISSSNATMAEESRRRSGSGGSGNGSDNEDNEKTPLLQNMVAGVPPVFSGLNKELDQLVEQPQLGSKTSFPLPRFAFARKDESGVRRPQAIAHRGYKAEFPENTMSAFRGAVDVGAEAIETDVHLSKDGVVVLSHDKDLKRCFGREENIIDCDYEFLSTLRTLQQPHEHLPRLADLLAYLAQPELEDIWLLLDIKLDNDADEVMQRIASTIGSVAPLPSRPWQERIVLGCWAAKYLPLCYRYLPGFSISHIGFSTLYASYFFAVSHVSFNMLQGTLMTPWGRAFIRKAQRDQRPVFAWTVNDDRHMRWDIRHGLDGVITDDPKRFLELRQAWNPGTKDGDGFGVKMWLQVAWIQILVLVFGTSFYRKYGLNVGKELVQVRDTK